MMTVLIHHEGHLARYKYQVSMSQIMSTFRHFCCGKTSVSHVNQCITGFIGRKIPLKPSNCKILYTSQKFISEYTSYMEPLEVFLGEK